MPVGRLERERPDHPRLELVELASSALDAGVVLRLLPSWEPYLAGWPEDRREAFEERAGVLEVEAGEEAERRAFEERVGHKVHNGSNGNIAGGAAT